MKRLFTLFWIVFFAWTYCQAEEPAGYKYWHDGKLSWDDFQDTLRLKGVPSSFNAFLKIENSKTRDGNTKTIRPEALACFDRQHSFADSVMRDENRLRLFQLKYDLLEIYRRRLQVELNLGVVGIAADNRMKQYMDLYDEQCQKAEQETENGQNEIKLQEWEFYVARELIENPAPSIPRISPRRFGYGGYIGTGASFPVGGIADYWDPAWQINLGIDLAYANTHLLCDFAVGTARTRRNIFVQSGPVNDVWLPDGHNTYTSISLGLGQQLVSTKYFALMPYAGCVWSGYSDQARIQGGRNERSTLSYSSFNWTAGICFDYRFSTTISLVPSFLRGHREIFTASIRTRLFINREQFHNFKIAPDDNGGMLRGCQLGFSISCHGFSRLLLIK